MRANRAVPIACLTVMALELDAAAPIPPDRWIDARVVAILAAPPDEPMHMPTDVCVDARGRVYVADGTNDRIIRFAPDGRVDAVIAGFDGEKLHRPVGVTVDSGDRLWIADSGNHRVLVVSAENRLIETIELPTPPGGRPPDPTDVVVSADGRRTYVVDNDNQRVVVRNNESKEVVALGREGSAPGQFRWPFMICRDGDGYTYVSEAIGARVQRLGPTDEWAGQVGGWGAELGRLYRPKGVATDEGGRLYVSDSTLGVIQVFDSEGPNLGVLTGERGLPLRFDHPMGMCFDSAGRLYVVELAVDRVAVVALASRGQPAETQPAGGAKPGAEP